MTGQLWDIVLLMTSGVVSLVGLAVIWLIRSTVAHGAAIRDLESWREARTTVESVTSASIRRLHERIDGSGKTVAASIEDLNQTVNRVDGNLEAIKTTQDTILASLLEQNR